MNEHGRDFARTDVAVIGVGQTQLGRREDVSTPELLHEAARAALADAGVGFEEIDSVFFGSAPDALIGVNQPDQWCLGAIGAASKPFMRISTGGSTGSSAAIAGYYAVASGQSELAVVAAVERAQESSAVQLLMNTNFDPIFERDFALNAISCYALATVDHMVRFGTTEEDLAYISVRNHANALNNPFAHLKITPSLDDVMQSRMLCWPVKLLDTCPRSDGACAIVLANAKQAGMRSARPAWVQSVHSYSDGYFIGERAMLSRREHMFLAAAAAYREAGITSPLEQIDVVEIQNPFTISELMAIEALGLCAPGRAGPLLRDGTFDMDGEVAINPSGGVLSSNPVGATSLIRMAEAALQVMGRAGARQVNNARRALSLTSGGAIQFGTVAIFGDEPFYGKNAD